MAPKQKAFLCKGWLKCLAAAVSLAEAGDKLFTFARFPESARKSIRASHAIMVRQARHEKLHEEFKRRIKTATVLPHERVEWGENRRHVVLGFDGFRADRDGQSRRLAKPRPKALRSGD